MYRPPKSGQPGAYVAPNARKEGTDAKINTGSDKDFPVLAKANDFPALNEAHVLKKPAPISFAALLKNKSEEKPDLSGNTFEETNLKWRLRVVDMPHHPNEKEEEIDRLYFANFKKLAAMRIAAQKKRENERRPRLFESSSSEEETQEESFSDEFWSDGEEDNNELEDAYDPTEFDRHR